MFWNTILQMLLVLFQCIFVTQLTLQYLQRLHNAWLFLPFTFNIFAIHLHIFTAGFFSYSLLLNNILLIQLQILVPQNLQI